MPCSINEILNVDFTSVSDEFNWITNSPNPIQTISGRLNLMASDSETRFTRGIGTISATNNRIRIISNLQLFRPQISTQNTLCAIFAIYQGDTLVEDFTVFVEDILAGQSVDYHLDREITYDPNVLSGNISLRITFQEGFSNTILLESLLVQDFNFCEDDVRTYFILDEILSNALVSQSSAVQLLQWKVGGIETLTAAFFDENNNPGSNVLTQWKLAKARVSGLEREANTTAPNTFNPLVQEWGLQFANTSGNHFGGKPTGVVSGSSYGTGILEIGFDKPLILNRILQQKDGVFFIDIDYSMDLLIVFNVVINNTDSSNVFNGPAIFREYKIRWDSSTCTKTYEYKDILIDPLLRVAIDQMNNGFLYGISGVEVETISIGCSESKTYQGNAGVTEFQMDFGSATGIAGITYSNGNLPILFEIEYDGQTYTTGYVGLDASDQDLLNLGINPGDINTGNPSTGSGQLQFSKTGATPNIATIRITTPFNGSNWSITGQCPTGGLGMNVEVGQGICGNTPISWDSVFVNSSAGLSYNPSNGDILYTDAALTTPYNGGGNTYRMRITNPPTQVIRKVQFDVSATGVISNVISCVTTPDITISGSDDSRCNTCWSVKINVPEDDSRKVSIVSSFASPATYATCPGTNQINANITDQVINDTTIYTVGVDAAKDSNPSSNTLTSTITVTVKDASDNVLSTRVLTRNHTNAIC